MAEINSMEKIRSELQEGMKLAQVALLCGGNDLGGTLMEVSISKSAGASSGEVISAEELEWIIRGIDRTPVQRDTLYRST